MKSKKRNGHLALVRHGESVWNAKGLWTGWQDVPLTPKGRKEALLAARTLVDIEFDLLITSDLKRASETLEIIKQELKLNHLPVVKHHAYKERHYGIFTGKNKWEIKTQVGETQFQKIRRGWDEHIPSGETLKDVYDRVIPHFLEHVLPKLTSGQNVLIAAHGNTHRALIKHIEDISHEGIEKIELATGEVIVYKLDHKGKVIKKEKRVISKIPEKQ